jgi:hypothetical protein
VTYEQVSNKLYEAQKRVSKGMAAMLAATFTDDYEKAFAETEKAMHDYKVWQIVRDALHKEWYE